MPIKSSQATEVARGGRQSVGPVCECAAPGPGGLGSAEARFCSGGAGAREPAQGTGGRPRPSAAARRADVRVPGSAACTASAALSCRPAAETLSRFDFPSRKWVNAPVPLDDLGRFSRPGLASAHGFCVWEPGRDWWDVQRERGRERWAPAARTSAGRSLRPGLRPLSADSPTLSMP